MTWNGNKPKFASHAENHTGVTIFDKTEPRSVYNLVSEDMQRAIENVHPDLFTWSEKALERHAKLEVRDYQLRIAFWREYNIAQDKMRPIISIHAVCHGVCSKRYFYDKVLTDFKKLAWVLYPPADYTVAMQELLDLSTREMRKVLAMPIKTKKGGVDHALIREKIKLHLALENRVKGAVVKSVAVAGRVQHEQISSGERTVAPKSLEQIEKEIRALESAKPLMIDAKATPSGGDQGPTGAGDGL